MNTSESSVLLRDSVTSCAAILAILQAIITPGLERTLDSLTRHRGSKTFLFDLCVRCFVSSVITND